MFKIDKLKTLFNCDLCKDILVDPITFTCGNTMCKRHISKLLFDTFVEQLDQNNNNLAMNLFEKTTFNCLLCQKEHAVPEGGFIVNKQMQAGLEIQLSNLNLSPAYDECKSKILKARENLSEIESLEKNSSKYIINYFNEIICQANTRRCDLKQKIDNDVDAMIDSIEKIKVQCIVLSEKANKLTADIERSKEELGDLISRFDDFEISDKKFEGIKESLVCLNQNLVKIIGGYNHSLIQNKNYSFLPVSSPFQYYFGDIKIRDKVFLKPICLFQRWVIAKKK